MGIFYLSKKKLNIVIITIVFLIVISIYLNNRNNMKIPTFKYSSNYFNNKTIVIDPGHGGVDAGAIRLDGLMEKDINLEIGKYLKELLDESGANCIITRDKDIELSKLSNIKDTRVRRDLNARVNIIDDNKAGLFVSIHINSFPKDKSIKGPIAFYYTQSEHSKELAGFIQKRLNDEFNKHYRHKKSNKPTGGTYYILRNTKSPGVIVENGFISNDEDYNLLKKDKFRYSIAYQIYMALGEYLNKDVNQ